MTTMPSPPPLNRDAIRQAIGLLLILTGGVGVLVGLWQIEPWAAVVALSAYAATNGYLLATVRTEET